MKRNRRSRRAGFTLVEMLVVIAIIGVLAVLLLPAIGMVRRRVAVGRIAMDLAAVEKGIEQYKVDRRDYPPDGSNLQVLKRHILTTWPRIQEPNNVWALLTQLDNAEALAFWLGGFSSDSKHPFTGPGGPLVYYGGNFYGNPNRNTGAIELDPARLTWQDPIVLSSGPPVITGVLSSDGDNDPFPVYLPPGQEEPYVYFDARTYGGAVNSGNPMDVVNGFYTLANKGYAKPYLSSRPNPASVYGFDWVNKNTFQIVSAGLDGHYGSGTFLGAGNRPRFPRFPTGEYYMSPGDGDDDNITNFSGGKTLGDMKP